MPKTGTRKLYYLLETALNDLSVGRDKLFRILKTNHMLIKPKRTYHITTNSHHRFRKHKNLIGLSNKFGAILLSYFFLYKKVNYYGFTMRYLCSIYGVSIEYLLSIYEVKVKLTRPKITIHIIKLILK